MICKPNVDRPMLTDRDSMLRQLHELRSEHRDLDTVIARLWPRRAVTSFTCSGSRSANSSSRTSLSWIESRLIPDNIA